MQGARVRSLVGELRSCMLHSAAQKKPTYICSKNIITCTAMIKIKIWRVGEGYSQSGIHRRFQLLIRFFLIYKFIYLFILFLVVLGLRCCTWAFSSWCRAGAALRYGALASPWGGFSCCGAWALGAGLQWLWHVGSVVVARGL